MIVISVYAERWQKGRGSHGHASATLRPLCHLPRIDQLLQPFPALAAPSDQAGTARSSVMLGDGPRPERLASQVGDVVEVVFSNKLERPVNLVLAGGLIPDSPAHLAAPIQPGHTVRLSARRAYGLRLAGTARPERSG